MVMSDITFSNSEARTVDDEGDNQLPKDSLLLITANQPVIDYLNACDHILYQCIADFLISDVLRPIPGTLTQAIRNFAKNLEGWLTNSLQGYPTNVTNSKVLDPSSHWLSSCLFHAGTHPKVCGIA